MKKTAIITGSSRGIGKAIVIALAKHGYNVIINYCTSKVAAHNLYQDLIGQGYNVSIFQADVSDRKQVNDLFKHTINTFGGVDLLINNAAISEQKLFFDITESEWDRMMEVNVKGVFNCCQEALPLMVSQGGGKIINISSIWGMVGASCEVHYSASKAAVIGLTKALAKEVSSMNIQVNCIAPGIIDTEMNDIFSAEEKQEMLNQIPLGKFGTGEDIADCVLFLASDATNYITGQVISPNGGYLI